MKAVALQSTDTGHTKGAQNGHISARPVSPWLIQPLSTFPRTTIQRKAGCACGGGCPSCKEELDVQPKLEISTPGDPLEQEADRVAGQVMRMPNAMRGSTGANQAPTIVHEVLRSPGDSLDSAARASMEPGFGRDFSAVRVHTDAKAAESARAVNALAYTVGHDIVFAEGQYSPQTQGGARLLAHELAHTVQHPESIDVLPFLEIGRIDDPAERAADLVADAVTRGEKASLAPARAEVPRLQRKCTASTTDRSDQRLVRCDDGEYRVTLTTAPASRVPDTRTSANAGWNNTDIFLNFEVCRGGTDVRIKPSVDLPRAIGQAIGNVVAGSGALTGATLSPGLEITIVQSDSFTLTLGPSVTVDRTGVTGGGLSATVQTPDITARGDVTYDAPSRTGFLTFTFSEGSPQRHVDCTRQGRERLVFKCERLTHVPAVPEVSERSATEVRYLFFEYPTAKIRHNFRLPTDIQSLSDQGYRVSSIEGFTSPEGPREREEPKFEGNVSLGQERADAALDWLRQEACPNCDLSGVAPKGRSELPRGVGSTVPETKGRAMERASVEEFLGTGPGQTPDPLAPHDPADVAAFRRGSPSRQRDRAFELMRRAEIIFTRIVQPYQAGSPARDEANAVDCREDVVDAARISFGISVVTGAKPR